jgi:hypothetical protein
MMYHKFIGDREVFSTCKSIQTDEGVWISNPAEEQIADAGWLPYVPPVVPPAPELEPDLSAEMEAVKKMFSTQSAELSDEDALEVAALFQTWASMVGKKVLAGKRLWWDGRLWKALQDIPELLPEWTPEAAVSLFTEVSVAEIREITDPIPAENPFMKDEKGRWKGEVYVSQIDYNTWTPEAYPAGWVKID